MNVEVSRRLAVILLLAVLGCTGEDGSAPVAESRRLRTVTTFYTAMQSKQGRAPTNEQEFKTFISQNGGPMLEQAGVASVDELFVSERDGQPFVVLYKPSTAVQSDVIAHEGAGVNGKRLVAHSMGAIEEVDETRFRELVPVSGATP